MKNPRAKGRYKQRLTIDQAREYLDRQMELPSDKKAPLEKTGRRQLIALAESRGWMCISIHCDEFLQGFPDTIWYHKLFGIRHVETKSLRKGHYLEDSQVAMFHNMSMHGTEVHVLRDASDYDLIFKPGNWRDFLPITNGSR